MMNASLFMAFIELAAIESFSKIPLIRVSDTLRTLATKKLNLVSVI